MAIVGTPAKRRDSRENTVSNGMVQESEVWLVTTDGTSEIVDIRDASPIPAYYTVHPTDARLYLSDKRVQPVGDSKTLWEVEVVYRGDFYGAPWYADPTLRETEIEWGTVETVENVDTDVNGVPIHNVVGEDFDPPLTAMRGYTQLIVTRNEAIGEFSATKAEAYRYHVNASTFFGAEEGTCLCKSITAKRMATDVSYYWKVAYEFAFKLTQGVVHQGYNKPWGVRVANKGMRQYDSGASGPYKFRLIPGSDGEAITEPVCLTLAGVPTTQVPGSITTYWLGFQVYPTANFSLLGLES